MQQDSNREVITVACRHRRPEHAILRSNRVCQARLHSLRGQKPVPAGDEAAGAASGMHRIKGGESMHKFTSILAAVTLILGVSSGSWSAQTPYHGDGPILLDPATLQWSDVASMAPGAKIAVIEGDLSQEKPFTFRLKLPANYRIDAHTHPAYERVTVLSGTLHFAHGAEFDRAKTTALPAGGVAIMPPGVPMFGYTEEETIIQLHGTGPWGIKYLNPAHDPRK
jgi:quercetin dioxygenase-like cupin family protein